MKLSAETSPLYRWRSHTWHPERFNELCRIIAYVGSHSRVHVQFEDGTEVGPVPRQCICWPRDEP